MSVRIDYRLCNGCPGRAEGCCEEICPGDLFYRQNDKAVLREPADCWDCCSCVKACPRAALSIELPFQISESLHRLIARHRKNHTAWKLMERTGKVLSSYSIVNRIRQAAAKTGQLKGKDNDSTKTDISV
jgi:adenylylsulfate reductase subunit B